MRGRVIRRALAAVIALAVATPVTAQDLTWDGSLWARFETRDVDDAPTSAFTVMRTRLAATGTFTPLVRMYAQAQDARRWGATAATAGTVADRLDLHQGYLEIGRFEDTPVWLRIGRQEYEVAFGRVLGTPLWAPTSRSYDGVRAATPLSDGARLELFGFQIAEPEGGADPADEYLAGAWAEFALGGAQTLHLFGLHDRDDAPARTARTTLGAQVDGSAGLVTWRLEAMVQAGTVDDLDVSDANLLAVFARVPVADGRGGIGVGFDRYAGDANPAAGETAGFSDLFGRNHRFLGFADLFDDPRANTDGRGLTDLNLRGTWRVTDELDLRVDWHRFALVDDDGFGTGTLGDEVDVQLKGGLIDALDIRTGVSWVGAEDPLVQLGRTSGDQLFAYLQIGAGF